ncbi:MAG: cyclic nucleotide-binding domain-containing protein [Tannerellaceae bacterium]|nr:cyclic nucleotide-binding domain-containing protein [Tannerellaceae bacterium]
MEIQDSHLAGLLQVIPEVLAHDVSFVSELKSRTHVLEVKKRDYILRTGEICKEAYFINKGLFVNFYIGEKGNESVTGFASDTEHPFLSAIGYFNQTPSEFEIRALEPGELICFSRTNIEELSMRYPSFAAYYQNVMLSIISKLYSLFAIRQSTTAEEFLRYLYDNNLWMINRIPDKYIACYMGISQEWYCKLKKRVLKLN